MRPFIGVIVAAVAVTAGIAAQTDGVPIVEVATLDAGTLKGEPARLAWSVDGSSLYLQSADRDRFGKVKSTTHFLISISARTVKRIDQEPDWASSYWNWKSGHSSPASPTSMIDVETKREAVRAVSAPTGGDLARGGGDSGATGSAMGDAASAAYQTQTSTIYVLSWKGNTIGEWKNEPVVPGVNFGWAPAPRVALAISPRAGGPIVIVDQEGRKEMSGSKAATLPAWSQDGTKIAWLERVDKKHVTLVIGDAPKK